MIDTAEFSIGTASKMAATSGSKDIRLPPPEPKLSSSEGVPYTKIAERNQDKRSGSERRESLVKQLQESEELLPPEHPFSKLMEQASYRLRPGQRTETLVSVSDRFAAMSLRDTDTVVISAGLVNRIQEYLTTKGKTISVDHIAYVIGHEISHRDEEAKKMHISETYCDTNSLKMMSQAGFNTDAALEAAELLEFLEEEESKKYAQKPNTQEITHPPGERRRILLQYIANDPDTFLEGRYAKPTPIEETAFQDFQQKSGEWLQNVQTRELISSSQEAAEQLDKVRTVSQALETFLSIDEFQHSQLSEAFASTPEFGNLILAIAVQNEFTQSQFNQLSKDDFKAQFKAINTKEHPDTSKIFPSSTHPTIDAGKIPVLTAEQAHLVQKCLNGEFKDPLKILTSDTQTLITEYPELAQFKFDGFFKGVTGSMNMFIRPRQHLGIVDAEIIEPINVNRAQEVLGLNGLLPDGTAISDGRAISEEIATQRQDIVDRVKVALSSSLIHLSQISGRDRDVLWDSRNLAPFTFVASETVKILQPLLPDYQTIGSNLKSSLIANGICQTEDATGEVVSMILSCGKYVDQNRLLILGEIPQSLVSPMPNLVVRPITVEGQQEIRDKIFRNHLSLALGGDKSSEMFGRPSVDGYIEEVHRLFRGVLGNDQWKGTPLDPYDIMVDVQPSVNLPVPPRLLDVYHRKPSLGQMNLPEKMFRSEQFWDSQDRNKCPTTDPVLVTQLVLSSSPQIKDKVISAVMNTDEIAANDALLRSILQQGIKDESLTQDDINQILRGTNGTMLYREFLPYLTDKQKQEYHTRYFKEFEADPNNQGLSKSEILVRFVTQAGGVISNYGYGHEAFTPLRFKDEWNKPKPEDSEYSFAEAGQAGDRIAQFVLSPQCNYSEEVKREILNCAATLKAYSLKLNSWDQFMSLDEGFARMGEGITSLEDALGKVEQLPPGPTRDRYLSELTVSLLHPQRHTRNVPFDLNFINRILNLQSSHHFLVYDRGDNISGTKHQNDPLPLREGSYDIAEMFPFRYIANYHYLDAWEQYAGMLETVNLNTTPGKRIDKVVENVHTPSSLRDYLLERILFPYVNQRPSERDQDLQVRLEILQKGYQAAYGERTKSTLGKEIVRIRLEQLGDNVDFEAGLAVILDTLPAASVTRDEFINGLLNRTYTTWGQIHRAQTLIMGHDYRTDEQAFTTRSVGSELLAKRIEELSPAERTTLIGFLLDHNQHVLSPEDLTPAFFTQEVRQQLKDRVVGVFQGDGTGFERRMFKSENQDPTNVKSWELVFTEGMFTQNEQEIIDYLVSQFQERTESTRGTSLEGRLDYQAVGVLRSVGLPEVLNMALPQKLKHFLQEYFAPQGQLHTRLIANTSLGPYFVSSTPEDRKMVIYRLCLGENGFFEDKNFTDQGKKVLDTFIDIATGQRGQVPEAEVVGWSEKDLAVIERVIGTTFENLSPDRRAEVFSRVVNNLIAGGGQYSREQVVKVVLSSFGVVGTKIAQMNQLIPKDLQESLASLKEEATPVPKTILATVMQKQDRTTAYQGVGPVIGGASTATAYAAKRLEGTELDSVIKIIRPDALKTLDTDLQAVNKTVRSLVADGVLKVDPSQIIGELRRMVAEEFDPRREAEQTTALAEGRGNRRFMKEKLLEVVHIKTSDIAERTAITTPKILNASDVHIEMTRAPGISLAKIERIKQRQQQGETLTPEEVKYAQLDLEDVYASISSDFFYQAFTLGRFHTDLHQGNVFVNEDRAITEIDHGQVGEEPSVDKRRALIKYTVGLARRDPRLITKAISVFAPGVNSTEVTQDLAANPDVFQSVTQILAKYKIEGSINRYTKALVNIYPYMTSVPAERLTNLMLPYVADVAVIFDIEETSPGTISDPVKEAIATKVESIKEQVTTVVTPVIDSVVRLNELRKTPEVAQAINGLKQAGIQIAGLTGQTATLLGQRKGFGVGSSSRLIRSAATVAGLISGRDQEARDIVKEMGRSTKEIGRNLNLVRKGLLGLRNKRQVELTEYQGQKAAIDEAIQSFGVEPPQV